MPNFILQDYRATFTHTCQTQTWNSPREIYIFESKPSWYHRFMKGTLEIETLVENGILVSFYMKRSIKTLILDKIVSKI